MDQDRTDAAGGTREGARLSSASVARNAGPIAEGWGALLPVSGRVLEVASGTGEHAVRLTTAMPGLRWRPSDPDATSRRSQAAWAAAAPDGAVLDPLALDATEDGWWDAAGGPYDVLFCANMIHIAPWAATEGLMRGAGALLGRTDHPGRALALYGPFSRRGAMANSNHRFDAALKARDPAFGVRDLDDRVQPLAARFGLALRDVHEMPANNLFVVFAPN